MLSRPFFLAGLAGYSDTPFRLLCRRLGAPYCVTEALAADAVNRGGRFLTQARPVTGDEPLAAQIIGSEPDEMATAAQRLVALGFESIDVNLACPSKKKKGFRRRGGSLLAYPDLALEILRAVRAATPSAMRTTVKLRRSYDDRIEMTRAFEQIFEGAYELGYAWATVHARTVQQGYVGESSWPFLRQLVARYPDRCIHGSGDIWKAEDIFRMCEVTGVQAAAVARGAIGSPWIFRDAVNIQEGREPRPPGGAEVLQTIREHEEVARNHLGSDAGGRQTRKFGIKIAHLHPRSMELRAGLIRSRNSAQLLGVLDRLLEPQPRS